jgi:hypothetical protein
MTNATGHTVPRFMGTPDTVKHCTNVYAWAFETYAEHVRVVSGDLQIHYFVGVPSTLQISVAGGGRG